MRAWCGSVRCVEFRCVSLRLVEFCEICFGFRVGRVERRVIRVCVREIGG